MGRGPGYRIRWFSNGKGTGGRAASGTFRWRNGASLAFFAEDGVSDDLLGGSDESPRPVAGAGGSPSAGNGDGDRVAGDRAAEVRDDGAVVFDLDRVAGAREAGGAHGGADGAGNVGVD